MASGDPGHRALATEQLAADPIGRRTSRPQLTDSLTELDQVASLPLQSLTAPFYDTTVRTEQGGEILAQNPAEASNLLLHALVQSEIFGGRSDIEIAREQPTSLGYQITGHVGRVSGCPERSQAQTPLEPQVLRDLLGLYPTWPPPGKKLIDPKRKSTSQRRQCLLWGEHRGPGHFADPTQIPAVIFVVVGYHGTGDATLPR